MRAPQSAISGGFERAERMSNRLRRIVYGTSSGKASHEGFRAFAWTHPKARLRAKWQANLRASLRAIVGVAVIGGMAGGLTSLAGCATQSPGSGSAMSKPAVPLHPNPVYANLPRYEGTLGKRMIVLHFGAKTDPEDAGGLHGEYQFVDTGEIRLVAGDSGEGGVIELDESDDGIRISGQWVGKLGADGVFKGVWSNVDESVTESIDLHRISGGAPGVGQ